MSDIGTKEQEKRRGEEEARSFSLLGFLDS
jgi:hypothetical protein